MQTRDISVDIAKGIGIILVVWGHSSSPCKLLLYSFHMPLFFFLAGFFLKNEPFKDFLYKKFRTLFVPFCFFYIVSLIIKIPFFIFFKYNIKETIRLLEDGTMFSLVKVDCSLWFLACLITTLFLWYCIEHFLRSLILKISAVVVLFVLGLFFASKQIFPPMYFGQACIVLPFIMMGNLYRVKFKGKRTEWTFVGGILLFALSYPLRQSPTNISLMLVDSNFLLYIIPALSGIIVVVNLSELLVKYQCKKTTMLTRELSKIGVLSLFIMALHEDLMLIDKVLFFFNEQPIIRSIVLAIILTFISYLLGTLLKKTLPYLWDYKYHINA